jgi:hypothetical protein
MRLCSRIFVPAPAWRIATVCVVLAGFSISACNLPVPASGSAGGPCGNAVCCCPAPQREAGTCCCALAAGDNLTRETRDVPTAPNACPRCKHKGLESSEQGRECGVQRTPARRGPWLVMASRCRTPGTSWAPAGQVLYPPKLFCWRLYPGPSERLPAFVSDAANRTAAPLVPPPRA